MKNRTIETVSNTLKALGATEYVVRLIHQYKPPISKQVEPMQLLKEVPFYQAKNREGYNIYFRPIGYQYVLVDDIQRAFLDELAKFKPCLLIETSPKNYQAWIKLQEVPQSRNQALQICQELATLLSADKGSAEPDHIGRLPGFTNRKNKHQQITGLYPYVCLHRWADRISPFLPQGGIVGQNAPKAVPNSRNNGNDRSREDFNLCCMLINQGKSDDYIRYELERTSSKAKEVKPSFDYINKTIRNARSRLLK